MSPTMGVEVGISEIDFLVQSRQFVSDKLAQFKLAVTNIGGPIRGSSSNGTFSLDACTWIFRFVRCSVREPFFPRCFLQFILQGYPQAISDGGQYLYF